MAEEKSAPGMKKNLKKCIFYGLFHFFHICCLCESEVHFCVFSDKADGYLSEGGRAIFGNSVQPKYTVESSPVKDFSEEQLAPKAEKQLAPNPEDGESLGTVTPRQMRKLPPLKVQYSASLSEAPSIGKILWLMSSRISILFHRIPTKYSENFADDEWQEKVRSRNIHSSAR